MMCLDETIFKILKIIILTLSIYFLPLKLQLACFFFYKNNNELKILFFCLLNYFKKGVAPICVDKNGMIILIILSKNN